jgi:predicted enzyme related to lactoylglutathione lyase
MADHTPPPKPVPPKPVPTVPAPPVPDFVLQPMVHVDDMPASIAFYERLGGSIVHGGPDTEWVLMQLGTAQIGLIARPLRPVRGESTVELNFHCTMPLDRLEKQLHGAGVGVAKKINDRTFGEQLHVHTPDGMVIKIHEREPVPYL